MILSGSGRIIVGNPWFSSVKTCVKLNKINGLYSNMLIKTTHKNYPRLMLREKELEWGQWTLALAEIDGLKIITTRFLDLLEKLFIFSCSTDLNGPPRQIKHHGQVPRRQVAFNYLSASASIDIHNHFCTMDRNGGRVADQKCSFTTTCWGVGFLLQKRVFGIVPFSKIIDEAQCLQNQAGKCTDGI